MLLRCQPNPDYFIPIFIPSASPVEPGWYLRENWFLYFMTVQQSGLGPTWPDCDSYIVMDHHGRLSLQPADELQIEIHICSHSQRSQNLTLSSAACCSHTQAHTQMQALCCCVCRGLWSWVAIFFFHTDWPSGPETRTHTDAQIHNPHIQYTHVCSHLIWAV